MDHPHIWVAARKTFLDTCYVTRNSRKGIDDISKGCEDRHRGDVGSFWPYGNLHQFWLQDTLDVVCL